MKQIQSPRLPAAPRSIEKGSSLANLLGEEAIECLGRNIALAHPKFESKLFRRDAMNGIGELAILQRGLHLAQALRKHLPARYDDAIEVLVRSLTPPLTRTDRLGLGVFF